MDRTSSLTMTAILSVLLLALGIIGYMLIEGWGLIDSLYMTVITLATVGYGEVHEVSQLGRVFTVILIVLGVGFFLYVVGNIIQFLVEGRMRIILGRRKLDKQINDLKNHYIVCGYGRIGRVLCRYLRQRNLDVVVIEKNQERIPILDEEDILYVIGEATDEVNLRKAGVDRAKGLVTALGTDAENVFLLLTAKQLNPLLYVVARASQNVTKKTLTAAGADMVVSPYDVGARRMAHAILRPSMIDFLELAFADESTDINIEEIEVSASSKLIETTLKDSGIRQDFNLIILAVKRADGTVLFNPLAETEIAAEDTLITVGKHKDLVEL